MNEPKPRLTDCEPSQADSFENSTVRLLVAGILEDSQKLARQQFELLVAEIYEQFRYTKRSAEYAGLSVVLLTIGFLSCIGATTFFLHDEFQVAIWRSLAISSAVIMVLGISFAIASYVFLERVSPIPHRTLNALRENVTWKTK